MSATSARSSADPSAARTSGQPASSPDDAALLQAVASGDDAAFERVITAHEADVYRFVHSLGVHGADAEDALQETFIAAWRGAGGFRGETAVRFWLFGIARNVVRHAQRHAVGEPADFEPLESLAVRAGWGGGGTTPTDQADPSVALVHAALARLTPTDREILVLRELEGCSGEATGAALGLTIPAMKSRLQRARLRLAVEVRILMREEDPS